MSPRSAVRAGRSSAASAKVLPCRITSAPKPRAPMTFTAGAVTGMTIVAFTPTRRAWKASAKAWFPAETATTPFSRSSGVNNSSLFSAPRSLKEAVKFRFSNFSHSSQPNICERVRE